MVSFQSFPHSHPYYVFVTKIPRMLILYFTFLKNKDNSPFNNTCQRIGTICFFVLFECFLLFLADSASHSPKTSRCPYLYPLHYMLSVLYLDHAARNEFWNSKDFLQAFPKFNVKYPEHCLDFFFGIS